MRAKDHAVFLRDPDLPYMEARHTHLRGSHYELHTHECFTFALIKAGCSAFRCRGGRTPMGPGAVIAILPDEPHACLLDRGQDLAYSQFYLDSGWLSQLLAEDLGRAPDFTALASGVVTDPGSVRSFLRLESLIGSGLPAVEKDAAFREHMRGILAPALAPAPAPRRVPDRRREVLAVREHLAANLGRAVPLEELAGVAGLSSGHLVRTFRSVLGLPPHAYQNQLRVERAKGLLAAGLPIAQVAQDTGFTDQSHFHRTFRRFVAATPGQYQAAG
ncbi:MAG: AraC family transcriptional regulator [Thermodesulfobacteriota bacterium]